VSCQLDTLKAAHPQTVRLILDGLPKTLDDTYENMLMKINMTLRKPAIRLFRCLVAAVRPLRVKELAEILSMDFDDEEADPRHDMDQRWEDQERAVLSACTSLVDVFDMDGYRAVQFSHPSVKEFLTSNRLATSSDRVSFYYIRQDSAHEMLARACLSALLRPTNGSPLSNYAARYWVDHVHSGYVPLLDEMTQLFDVQKPYFSAWITEYDVDVSSMTGSARPILGTPLYYATLCNLYDLAKHLLDVRPEDINVEGGQYTTAIHAALYKGHLSIAHLLIERGADVRSRDKENSTPLHIATRIGDTKMMEHLISCGADVNAMESGGSCPLFIALNDGNPEAISLLVDRGADVNVRDDKSSTPLHITSHDGLTDLVKALLDRGADVDAQDKHKSTPLHLASPHQDPTIVQSLIEYGANVNVRDDLGSTALSLALHNDNFKVVELLIQHGADVNILDNQQQSPLHLAALRGNLKIAGLLVEKGARVNARNKDESTPIHLASNRRVVELLIKHGAHVTAQDNNGSTPLHLASDDGNFELVKLLIERGADVNARDKRNSTPLHIVSRRGPIDAVKLLLDSGAEINAQNDEGWTALHIASHEGAVGVVKCLLATGRADTNIGDADRRTPVHLASRKKNSMIVQLLNEARANLVAWDNRNQIPYQLPSVTSPRVLSPSPSGNPSQSSPYNRLAGVPFPLPFSSGAQNFSQEETRSSHISSPPSSPHLEAPAL
jgi:ankyrin repeat protein